MTEPEWEALRAREFPGRRINLNPGTLGTPARRVREAMAAFYEDDLYAYPLGQYQRGREALLSVRALATSLWGGAPALHEGTTACMHRLVPALARCLGRRDRPPFRVLTTSDEHEGGAGGFVADPDFVVQSLPDLTLSDPDQFGEQVRVVQPDVLFLSEVLWTDGRRLPVDALVAAARAAWPAVWVVLDAAQVLGRWTPSLAGDCVVASGHKWLYGPQGTGFLWLSARAQAELGGLCPAGHPLDPQFVAARFESGGGQDFSRLAGLHAALTLYQEVGPDVVQARSAALGRWFAGALSAALRTVAHRIDDQRGMVILHLLDRDPYPLYMGLNERGIHVKCIKRRQPDGRTLNLLRFGLPWYESQARLSQAIAAVADLLRGW